jgi:amino acid transporter
MQSRNMREQLQRVLRTPGVLFIGINGVVGGGIFLLPGQVAQSAGAAAVWAYLAAGFVVVLIGLSFAEVSTMYDRTGGPLVYADEAMGKMAGFTVGWMVWLLSPTKPSTAATTCSPSPGTSPKRKKVTPRARRGQKPAIGITQEYEGLIPSCSA